MNKQMKRKRVLGIGLILSMLIVTACGQSQNTASKAAQDSKANAQVTEPIIQESELQEYLEAEAAEPEIQSDSAIQEDDAANQNLPVQGNSYYDLANVVLYLEVYGELPPNYITKSEAQALGWEGGSVEKYKAGAAIGGDTFGNREGLLPAADGRKYTECDIDTHGYKSRGSRRLVFSNDGLYFYTSDHYETFSEVSVTEDYEVVW